MHIYTYSDEETRTDCGSVVPWTLLTNKDYVGVNMHAPIFIKKSSFHLCINETTDQLEKGWPF